MRRPVDTSMSLASIDVNVSKMVLSCINLAKSMAFYFYALPSFAADEAVKSHVSMSCK